MSSSNVGSSDAWDCRHDSSDHSGSRGHSSKAATAPTSPYNTSYSQSTYNDNDCTPSYGYSDSTPSYSTHTSSRLTAKAPTRPQRNYSSQPRPRVTANAAPAPAPPKAAPQPVLSAPNIIPPATSPLAPKYTSNISQLPVLSSAPSVSGSSATHSAASTPTTTIAPVGPAQTSKATALATPADAVKESATKKQALSVGASQNELPECANVSRIAVNSVKEDVRLSSLASQATVKHAEAVRSSDMSDSVDPEIGKPPFPKAVFDDPTTPSPTSRSLSGLENPIPPSKLSFLRALLTRSPRQTPNTSTLPVHQSDKQPRLTSNADAVGSSQRSWQITAVEQQKPRRRCGLSKKVWIFIGIFVALVIVAVAVEVPVSRASAKRKSKAKSSKSKTKEMS